MKCFRCQDVGSPPNARFCVACGYALLQSCPYGCGHQALPVRAAEPPGKCPSCEKFFTVCPTCSRLHLLGARGCETLRCALAKTRPIEPFAFHSGTSGGLPMPLRRNWESALPALLSPGWETPPALAPPRGGGLASRYGLIVWWQDAQLWVWPCPRPGGSWPVAAPASFDFFEPLPGDGLLPAHRALLLSHGHAYGLHAGGAARVSPGEAASQSAAQSLSLRSHFAPSSPAAIAASRPGSEGELEFIELEFETVPIREEVPVAAPVAAPVAVIDAALLTWEPHEVEWLAQTATSTWWLALGQRDDALVGVRARGADALFEGEVWTLPPQIDLSQWRELLVWHDAPALRTLDAIWRQSEPGGAWQRAFALNNSPAAPDGAVSLDGAMPGAGGLWLWGRHNSGRGDGRLWVRYLDESGAESGAEISVPLAAGDRIFPFPIVRGSQITFFQTGSSSAITTLDLTRPFDDPQRQEIPAAITVIWASAATHPVSGAQWLLYATDDGTIVSLWLMAMAPQAGAPISLMKVRPHRARTGQDSGATFAATLGADCLLVSCASENAAWIRAFEWPQSQTPVTNSAANS